MLCGSWSCVTSCSVMRSGKSNGAACDKCCAHSHPPGENERCFDCVHLDQHQQRTHDASLSLRRNSRLRAAAWLPCTGPAVAWRVWSWDESSEMELAISAISRRNLRISLAAVSPSRGLRISGLRERLRMVGGSEAARSARVSPPSSSPAPARDRLSPGPVRGQGELSEWLRGRELAREGASSPSPSSSSMAFEGRSMREDERRMRGVRLVDACLAARSRAQAGEMI